VTIGSELLLGQIVDTNTSYLAQELGKIGISIGFRTAVGDRIDDMVTVIQRAAERCDMVITTGGLGPTRDDLTRDAVARAAGVALEFRQDLMDQVSEVFERNGFHMPDNNRLQAFVPVGSQGIRNSVGTAPGFIRNVEETPVICLPGVPRELKHLMRRQVIPRLREMFSLKDWKVTYRVLNAVGLSESRLDSLIGDLIKPGENPDVGLLASQGEIKIRISVAGKTNTEARALIKPVEQEIRNRLGRKIYGAEGETLEGAVESLLGGLDLSLAIMETYSGGAAARRFHELGSSRMVESRVISDRQQLAKWLNRDAIEMMNSEIAQALARKIKDECGSQIGLAILGFPVKNDKEYSLQYHTAVQGAGVEAETSREMSGDLPMLMQRGIITSLDMLRLVLLNRKSG
jgi:nicotinamide-nucleotide amidase